MASKKKRPPVTAAAAAPKLTLSGGEPHNSTLPTLALLWRDSRFTDITVCAEGVECKAHRVVLASSSGYFLGLFASGMRGAEDTTHTLEGMRAPVLKAVLAFVYEGSCEIEESQLTDLLDASAQLMVEPLKAACAAMMAAQLSPDNALEVWRIAEAFSLLTLEKAAVESALGGFEELPPQLASGSQVLALVQEDRLTAKDEEAVFKWIARWWEVAERPEAELMAVLKHVRFATMDEGFLRDTVRAIPTATARSGIPNLIYLVGGLEGGKGVTTSTVRAYDPALDSWCELSSMATERFGHAAAALDGKLYVIGGSTEDKGRPGWQATAADGGEVYDPKADGWQPLPSMPTARELLAVAAVGGKVYAIGGCNRDQPCDAVEAYDPITGAWTELASFEARYNHTATVVEGKIYVMGGAYENDEETDRVDAYDPATDSWQQMASMPTAKLGHSAAVWDGKIYVSGGHEPSGCLYSEDLEVYDPASNTWTTLARMHDRRAHHSSVVVDGKLCVFAGFGQVESRWDLWSRSEVEVYNIASDRWVRAAHLPSARAEEHEERGEEDDEGDDDE
eukprot:scaffold51565_cov74-Phaeocystis_antarctica.AAC.2